VPNGENRLAAAAEQLGISLARLSVRFLADKRGHNEYDTRHSQSLRVGAVKIWVYPPPMFWTYARVRPQQLPASTFADRPVRTPMENVSARGARSHLLIADDHAMFAETLRVYLEKTFTVVGVVGDGPAMVRDAMRLRPDVIVVDVSMPLLNGLDAARKIKEQVPTSNSCS
jgi:hypothetical protein